MEPEHCARLNHCHKVRVVLDKDLLDPQYADAIRNVCAKCNESCPKDKEEIEGVEC